MKVAFACETMGWTYQEYMEQPRWLVDVLYEKWRADAEMREAAMKKSQGRL